LGHDQFQDRRLNRIERREHPGDGAGVGIVWQQAAMPLRDVQIDRAGFEEDETAFLIGGDLAKGM
jgi:hypothetical protein